MSEIRSGGIQGILPVPVQVLDKPRTAKFGHWREMTFYASAQYRGIHLRSTLEGAKNRRTKALKQLVDLDEAIVEMERSAAVHKIVQRVQGGIPQRAQEE
jgi:hypothetical protein